MKSSLLEEDDNDDDDSSEENLAGTVSSPEEELNDGDYDEEEEDEYERRRGPILESQRSEEAATPLYLANEPIRVHKYNFALQHVDDEDNKIDKFVKFIEGQDQEQNDDENDDDDDDDEDESTENNYMKREAINKHISQLLFPSKSSEEDDSSEPSSLDDLIKNEIRDRVEEEEDEEDRQRLLAAASLYNPVDEESSEEEDKTDIYPIDPRRAAELNKFVLLANEKGVPTPVSSDEDEDDDEESSSEEQENEDKILERIHHDLQENLLIESLVDRLEEQQRQEQDREEDDESIKKLEKRFRSLFSEPRPLGAVKALTANLDSDQLINQASDMLQDQENMVENGMKSFQMSSVFRNNNPDDYFIDDSYFFMETNRILDDEERRNLMEYISAQSSIPLSSFKNITQRGRYVMFKLENADRLIDDDDQSSEIVDNMKTIEQKVLNDLGIKIVSYGIGRKIIWSLNRHASTSSLFSHPFNINPNSDRFILITIVTCISLTFILVLLTIVYVCKRRSHLNDTLVKDVSGGAGGAVYRINFSDDESLIQDKAGLNRSAGNVFSRTFRRLVEFVKCSASCKTNKTRAANEPTSTAPAVESKEYEELCRQRAKGAAGGSRTGSLSPTIVNEKSDSPRSSTSSWSEEPIKTLNIDITTGHTILSYMEEHLNDKHRLQEEWSGLCEYEPDPNKTDVGSLPENMTKNRYSNILPFDHSRVKLKSKENDYINANYIIDDDPRNPSYIAAQGPLMHTTNDFWQMVWEEESVVIVSLCRTIEYGSAKCHQFWPSNGSCVYDKFEIHLVSEHVWCEDYLVRNFFLKNLEQNQTRTVTQFHFLTWPENGVPQNIKSFLDFRRKVNKSFKAKSSPLVIHCNDGVGRTGTYLLIDMVLNKISKGAKEIDIAATLEYLRDQRPGMIKNKAQFEYSFAVITEELHNMLKALRQ